MPNHLEDVNRFFKIRLYHLDSHWKNWPGMRKVNPMEGHIESFIYSFNKCYLRTSFVPGIFLITGIITVQEAISIKLFSVIEIGWNHIIICIVFYNFNVLL